ncbi:MAG TPA: hypothetical protein ENJ50_06945, partial [Planctomycetaceae bacterium]|nr:hypothetical protein [Planctomycetaceae bacterium]
MMALERTERLALWYLFCSLAGLSTNIGATDVGASEPGSNERAQWIWCVPDRAPRVRAVFQGAFELDQLPTSAWLRCAGESAGLELFINGAPVASRDPYDPLFLADVVESLRRGHNTISVQAASCQGPAAFFLQLELTLRDGSRKTIATDRQWLATVSGRSTGMPAVEFGVVDDKLLVPIERRVEIVATDNYEQWRQASGAASAVDGARFVIAPGFEIQLVRTAAPSEGSWVSMAFDRAGRLILAKEKEGLLRLTLTEDGGAVRQVESIDDRLEECRGLLCVGEDLFANANNSKALYRLVGDGKGGFRKPEVVFASTGGVGHGRNDLALGPDGMIYTIHGDAVDLLKKAKDFTSPFREARRGRTTREGHLLRVDPRSGKIEILLSGLRNPFGIAFNRDGEAFTYDADAEYDMGAPWYRPTRVNHLAVGGDYGWRGVTKQWPPYYPDHPDNALPNLDIGKGSPTAIAFGTESSFPGKYRDALFVLD